MLKTCILLLAVVGCPSIKAPANSVVKRQGKIAVIECDGSDIKWELICDGNAWIGQVGSCVAGRNSDFN